MSAHGFSKRLVCRIVGHRHAVSKIGDWLGEGETVIFRCLRCGDTIGPVPTATLIGPLYVVTDRSVR